MCLAIPGKILESYRDHEMLMGKVQFGGITKRICLEYVPEAQVGDYVLVHVGFALAKVDEEEAQRIFEMLQAIGGLDELDDPQDAPPLYRKIEPASSS